MILPNFMYGIAIELMTFLSFYNRINMLSFFVIDIFDFSYLLF